MSFVTKNGKIKDSILVFLLTKIEKREKYEENQGNDWIFLLTKRGENDIISRLKMRMVLNFEGVGEQEYQQFLNHFFYKHGGRTQRAKANALTIRDAPQSN